MISPADEVSLSCDLPQWGLFTCETFPTYGEYPAAWNLLRGEDTCNLTMPFEKSLYEMTNEELAELRPDDFTEAFIKSNDPLVEEWAKTPWLQDDRGGAIPGKTARERDYNRAVIARTLQNYVNEFLGYRGRNGQGQQVPLTVAESVDRMAKAAGAVDNQFPDYDKINEAASAATTSAWSGATTLPLVLGYARKIMPKMQALENSAL